MLHFEPVQPIAQKMKNKEEVNGDENCVDHQLDCKHAQAFPSVLFHEERVKAEASGQLNWFRSC